MTEPRTAEQEVPRWARRFVYGFLAVLLLCGVARVEAWPFSGFRLFSSIRSDERVSWQIYRVDEHDHEELILLGELPVAYRNTTTILAGFDSMSADDRDEVCDAWARPLRDRGLGVESVRVYRKVKVLRDGAPPPTRELTWECGA